MKIEESKVLTFTRIKNLYEDDKETLHTWELSEVNGKEVFYFADTDPSVYFTMKEEDDKGKYIELNALYPTFPTISGVDLLQFLSTLSFVCKQTLELIDASDVRIPYMLIYGKSYYDFILEGESPPLDTHITIKKEEFLNCLKNQLNLKHDLFHIKIIKNIKGCESQSQLIDPENCPLGFNIVGKFLYKKIFLRCGMKFSKKPRETTGDQYVIRLVDWNRLMEKLPPIANVKPTRISCTAIQNYDALRENLGDSSKIKENFQTAFEVCFEEKEETTPLILFKTIMRCVSIQLNNFWKCKSNLLL